MNLRINKKVDVTCKRATRAYRQNGKRKKIIPLRKTSEKKSQRIFAALATNFPFFRFPGISVFVAVMAFDIARCHLDSEIHSKVEVKNWKIRAAVRTKKKIDQWRKWKESERLINYIVFSFERRQTIYDRNGRCLETEICIVLAARGDNIFDVSTVENWDSRWRN